MATTSPHQLLLLADHIKLSLLERQRAQSLDLPAKKQDTSIRRSLAALRDGIASLERQKFDQDAAGEDTTNLADEIARLTTQADDLTADFSAGETSNTATEPNSTALASDFAAAQKPAPRSSLRKPRDANGGKAVRFRDSADDEETAYRDEPDEDPAARAALFNSRPYSDEPEEEPIDQSGMSNQQIHIYHKQVIQDQDEQLDTLGRSIGRQRELSIAMGNELDDQAVLLEDVEQGVDRHTTSLEGARKRLGTISRKAKDNWSWVTIGVLVLTLVLLLVVLK